MESLVEAILDHAKSHPEKKALYCDGKGVTYSELGKKIRNFAFALKAKKIGKGSRVILEVGDLPSFFFGFLGCHLYGCVAVPVEKNVSIYKLQDVLRLTRPKLIFMDRGGEQYADYCDFEQTTVPDFSMPAGETICTITSTTGTTGKPSLIAHDNRGMAASVENLIVGTAITQNTVLYENVPVDLASGYRRVFAALSVGACAVVSQEPFSKDVLSRSLDLGITHLTLICSDLPWLVSEELPGEMLSGVTAVESVAGILPADTIARFYRKFPNTILYNVYGSTESGCILINDTRENPSEKCIGKPAVNARLLLVDENGNKVDTPEKYGYITVKGDMNMRGYYKKKKLTETVMTGKGLVLNDIAYYDREGFYYFVSRVGDIINVKGYKITPTNVENVALQYDGIHDCACVGREDRLQGQFPVLYVESEKGQTVDPEELMVYLRERLESYSVPADIIFVDKIPRTVSGKLMRKSLSILYGKQ